VDRGAAVLLTAFVGGLIALQAPINSGLGRSIGSFQAAFVSFAIGTVALCLIATVARGGLGQLRDIGTVPAWYYLTGGLLGAAYVTTVLVTVRSLGAGGVTAATVAGQLSMSMVVDQLGWLGVEKSPITALKVLGVLLLAAGTYLIVRE
jgi:bacterial/archaeal transporter family-2 protein